MVGVPDYGKYSVANATYLTDALRNKSLELDMSPVEIEKAIWSCVYANAKQHHPFLRAWYAGDDQGKPQGPPAKKQKK